MPIPATEIALTDFILDVIRREPQKLPVYSINALPTAKNNMGVEILVPDSTKQFSVCVSDGDGMWIDIRTGLEVV